MSKKPKVQVKLLQIKELSFHCNDILENLDNKEIDEDLEITLGFNFEPDIKDETIKANTIVTFSFKEEEFLKYENQLSFSVINIDKVFIKDGENIKIKDDFLVTLINISIGTTRGLLAKTTLGKKINEFPIPIIDSEEIMKQISESNSAIPSA